MKPAPREPPAAPLFDIAPAPPMRVSAQSVMFHGSLSHAAALRRTLLDRRLAALAVPAVFCDGDDPERPRVLRMCGVDLAIPPPFEANPVAKAYEAALDRAEVKFRAGRKDKSIGGEFGSIVFRKKGKGKKWGKGVTGKRPFGAGDMGGRKRPRLGGYDLSPSPSPPPARVDYTEKYRVAVKTELVKAARARVQHFASQLRLSRGMATACARDARKPMLKSVRVCDDSYRRGRRILRDVLHFWKKEDKDRQEERKRLMARADEIRRKEAEEREAQRQKNKLKFLLGQSEAFSSFLHVKEKATDAAAAAAAKVKGDSTLEGITGEEDDAELKAKAAANAAEMLAAHRSRLAHFDTETMARKKAANADAEKLAADRDEVARAVSSMNGVTDAEMEALRDGTQDTNGSSNTKRGPQQEGQGGALDGKPEVAAVKQPSILNCTMKDYQLRGLSWLVSLYDQGINGILADEMGLGKTLQTISFLAYLAEQEDNWGPFLVISPKATLHNWQQEVTKFCPDLRVLPYWGSKSDRAELRKYWSQKRMYRRDSEFHVCITSYETLITDEKQFHRVKWQYVVLDEAQAIKNSNSSRWRALLQFPCRNRLLLTGTPLQNKLSELWSLLHFIMPAVFDSHAEFADWFAKDIEGHAKQNKLLDLTTLTRLRTLLDPFMLRRVKRDVESEMPPKTEVQLRCYLTSRQRELYASVRSNLPVAEIIRSMSGGGGGNTKLDPTSSSQLMNIFMQLRKVCNHPETFERRVPVAPFQFQAPAPPPHVPPPPAVLSGGNAAPPLDVTLITRSMLDIVVPRALDDMEDARDLRGQLLRIKFGLWNASRARRQVDSGLAVLPCLSGLSASEVCSAFVGEHSSPIWFWHDLCLPVDEHLERVCNVYGFEQVLGRPHWLLQQVRARTLRRARSFLAPGHGSPAELIVQHTRILRHTTVYLPKVLAPTPALYMPGCAREGADLGSPRSKLFFPDMPRETSRRSTSDVYSVHRGLLGNIGEHVGSHPITMPDARRLVADSGKMTVLDSLLRRLKAEGHKCLIYSQFTRVLDILEDYCGKSAFKFVRLDGQSALADRRDIVAEWQSNEELFIFLLSTRAGGVGLNLTAADTVLFYDSDWNPTQDLQAMDRAHRLGQERPVTVYRLTSIGTIEERMLIRAQQKSRINDLVIKGGGIQSDKNEPQDAAIDDIAALLMDEDDDVIDMDRVKSMANKASVAVSTSMNGNLDSARAIYGKAFARCPTILKKPVKKFDLVVRQRDVEQRDVEMV